MHAAFPRAAATLALVFTSMAWARDAAVAPAPVFSARQQALMATVVGSATHPRILQVRLDELHPTQPAIGYDQVYYKLGRYAAEEKHIADIAKPKKFADLCEANGQGDVLPNTANVPGATLSAPPAGYRCKAAVGSRPDDMKTVVIGPRGIVYLTDGHHTFSTFWEADGGRNRQMKVWVKVSDNFSALGEAAFWTRMREENKVWLKNGRHQAITPRQLPSAIGLQSLGDDPYRSLVYFTRGIGYEPPEHATEFLEFYWAGWLRRMPALDLARVDLRDATAYANAVLLAAQAMVALQPDDIVSGGKSARELGALREVNREAFDELIDDKGKLRHAIAYKKSLAQ
ncbi:ParB/Srx family N-terminal domain-containing protein [Janthinobacterium sp. NKUCC08_JDC]|uniref:ParB/Srx family N-terminal domain-containing protein n=1 Tax=Janthinobacterium sp. NKUCC08_JDC TaxID=2842122 RepID=UPI001C5B1F6F|nr:ParB/Srx family N-terminal domain-containing protein [Janthinobacterium sp. NKUCC08_JDC]MBW3499121.1 ParB/Srx family N-terminal domain-containing protein [Janthinobacterium sp. NKUCC08_JDC]